MRPVLLVLALVVLAGVVALGWAANRETPFEPRYEGRPPNVLLISVDTLRADHMGVYGYGKPTTPRIDAWARDAVVFEDAQASASWTLPGLASVMTSYFSSTHRCWTFASSLHPSFPTLAEMLRDAGYDSMAVTSHVFLARAYGLQQGYVHFDDEFAHPVEGPHHTITSPIVSDRGIRFLENKAACGDVDPWILWVHYFDPHSEYVVHEGVSEPFGTATDAERYDGEIAFTDLHIGRLLDRLEELALDDDTVVVFFSDHGEEFMDHGSMYHGHALYRELVRVPLIMKIPGVDGGRVDTRVRTVDVLPTVLDLVPPLEPPASIEGVSLLPMLQGGEAPVLASLSEIRLNEASSLDCIVEGRWKLIVDLLSQEKQLYDVEADPLEQNDVADAHPDLVEELTEKLRDMIRHASDVGDTFPHSEELDLTPTQLENMQDLGYAGGGHDHE